MSVGCRVILAACAFLSLVSPSPVAGADTADPASEKTRNMSSSPSTARTTSRNGSAAARWPRGPARTSPISCPACSCCRLKRGATTARRACAPESPMSALRGRRRRSPTGSREIRLRRLAKATRSPAMAAAISTARTGARPTGCANSAPSRASCATPIRINGIDAGAGRLAALRRDRRSRVFARPTCRPARAFMRTGRGRLCL